MTTPNTLTPEVNKNSGFEASIYFETTPKDLISDLLEESGVNNKRFVDVEDGTKASYKNHSRKKYQYAPEAVAGNYGVLAGWGLIEFDIDDYKEDEEIPDLLRELLDEHPTFRIRTPHGGLHLYYLVPEDAPERIKGVCRSKNPTFGAVEIKSSGLYVMGPGSEISHDDCNNCDLDGVGHYRVDRRLAFGELPFEDLIETLEELSEQDTGKEYYTSEAGQFTPNTDIGDFVEQGRENDEYLSELMDCLGDSSFRPQDYPLVRYSDRSKNEVALAGKLMRRVGGFDGYEEIVRGIMNDLRSPKWTECGDSYRDSVIEAGKKYSVEIGKFYNPYGSGKSSESGVAQCHAENILLTVKYKMPEKFTTGRVAELVGLSERHIRKVLNDLVEAGYLTKTFVKDDEHFKKIIKIDVTGPAHDLFMDRYNTVEEIKEIQHEYLVENSGNEKSEQPVKSHNGIKEFQI